MKLPDNLVSHRDSWQKALVRLIEIEPNRDDREYYEHELNAMQDMYSDLDSMSDNTHDDDYDNERITSGV